jgi:coproporphyrinogen III oxidase-like Fe-S oxidoreductase
MNTETFTHFFRDVERKVDVDSIRAQWMALSPHYDVGNWVLPLPPWRHRPYEDSGPRAWEVLQNEFAKGASDNPFCIYLHIPFCSSKCGFCDNYSFKLGSHQQQVIQGYVDLLCDELKLWSRQGNLSLRPVSTIHLGGGAPTFIGESALRQIIECCKGHFAVNEQTELALESTVQSLTPTMIQTMHELGFRRLHIGVQTLQDDVRSLIGRRNPSVNVLQTITRTLELGWVVSVDLICGLPSQTLSSLIHDIETLIEYEADGFSLYEYLVYPQNRRWSTQHGLTHPERHLSNYWMLVAGATLLESRGLTKNLFNHWVSERDKNVYFTFPTRGEDLLAVGTIADGVFGDYHYRHPRYASYLKSAHSGFPGLEGGLRHDAAYQHIHPFIIGVQSGTLAPHLLPELWTFKAVDGTSLVDRWIRCGLVSENDFGGLDLTPSGSWFAGNLIAEIASYQPSSDRYSPTLRKHDLSYST